MKTLSNLRRMIERWRLPPSTGERGENLAATHLKKQGYRILARNVRNRTGEIDIVAQAPDERTVVIVEVKASAASLPNFTPEMHVTPRKQRKLITLAAQLAKRYKLTDRPIRFDVIAIENVEEATPVLRHHQGAFTSDIR